MHDVIDSPMARREKTVTAGAAWYISLQSLTPEKPKGTILPPVLTPRRSLRLAAKQSAIPSASTSGPSVSTPVREALRKSTNYTFLRYTCLFTLYVIQSETFACAIKVVTELPWEKF